jgi:hypothetical protein
MRTIGGFPVADATARTLGVRPGIDIDATRPSDLVPPNQLQGMSVAPDDPMNLPDHRRPVRLGGTGKDPVWSIEEDELGPELQFERNRPDHGVMGPAAPVTLAEFANALKRTREQWRKVDD